MKPSRTFAALALLLLATAAALAAEPTPEQLAAHVLNRLAYGPKPGDIERVASIGVQRYIDSQLDANPAALPYPAGLMAQLAALDAPARSAGDLFYHFTRLQKEAKDKVEGAREGLARIALDTSSARVLRAIDSPRQLEEVMVEFWFNHFNVFSGKGPDRALVASYERDAIRPYVFGSFRAMLGATAKHPAMLHYLDNYLSTAPGYQPSLRQRLAANAPKAKANGLNENYARELMELHTLGVDGGYTQADVTELARMLTGWTYEPRRLATRNEGFRFDPQRHDVGIKHWLGREVKPAGQGEGEMALDVLAVHPATARHISTELARFFVHDAPPPALVERMARSWIDSNGDIRNVLRTLFASPEFMAPAAIGAKFKTPYQYVISAARAATVPLTNVTPLLGAMAQLGMPLYGCPTPDGYKNTQDAWLNPDALSRRIGFATALANGRLPLASEAPALPKQMAKQIERAANAPAPSLPALDAERLQATLGALISPATRSQVAANAPALRAAMLLGSPDFMQR